jgi:predicted heme/steroid binding protein
MYIKFIVTFLFFSLFGCNRYTHNHTEEKSLLSCGALMQYHEDSTSKIGNGKVIYKSPECMKVEINRVAQQKKWTLDKLEREYAAISNGGAISYTFDTSIPSYDISIAVRTKTGRLIGLRDSKKDLSGDENGYQKSEYKVSVTCYVNEAITDTANVFIVDNAALISTKILLIPDDKFSETRNRDIE